MPDTMPTMWDILGYQKESEEFSTDKYRPSGQGDMLSYLSSLLQESEWMTDEMKSHTRSDRSFYTDIYGEKQSYGSDYEEAMFKLSQLLGAPMEEFEGRNYGHGWTGQVFSGDRPEDRWEEFMRSGNFDEFAGESLTDTEKSIFEAIQGGFRAAPTSESFGLERKIGDIETAGKRELKSAREGYVPGEILSRYGALQGKAGAQQKGEQLEQAYTGDIYGVQRGMGRDIKSTQEDFKDEWFGGIESWISNLG